MKDPKVFIIAEAGVNHNGSLSIAKKMVDVAVSAGADAIKFQTFHAETLVVSGAPKAQYQMKRTAKKESQYAMLKKLELSFDEHRELADFCRRRHIEFMSTPFDAESVGFLKKMKVKRFKLSSGEITNAPLLLETARSKVPILLSTGMSTIDEIRTALGVLAFGYFELLGEFPGRVNFERAFRRFGGSLAFRDRVTLLHCTSEYPAPYDEINLRAMDTLAETFHLPIGFSDHSCGISCAIAAAARGAVVLEKHFTLDRKMQGPDHHASIGPAELTELVNSVRQIQQALGDGKKIAMPSEKKNRSIGRRSLVASRAMNKGELFSEENLTAKRPGCGLSPMRYFDLLGKKTKFDLKVNQEVVL